ncbi:diaminopimelate decarboxylase [Helicobacter pullorum]|uniref:Diaminopimelate decarboxylase n=1 Tax=Helicobacter pullorum TaxID=35818 RepID=A0A0N1E7L4_9HELI|nr:diaminopimelate decarboxylase [Helicobacter pullorum]OCR04549.1 diaminopimelate decarboxylase [Helicobacter pullorum]OCR07346.1 diaminopimelate decarboxylase [Helicobacter pullorum]OCR09928.1 diaminopimelate decarboxylase [Helicobacter pullorum]OCR12259.1 diaminopimelate decarboxylase [Helicobacter pullorum]
MQIAKEYQTPIFAYDFDKIEEYYHQFKSAFSGRKTLICYALKANSNLSVVKKLASLESGADCVSLGEIKRAILAGIPPYKIIYSGVGKQEEEIKEAIKLGILFINIESKAELFKVESIAKSLNTKARISIRVNPDIDPQTHPYISTGLKENKFGIEIQEAKSLYLHAHKSEFLEPIGIHFHIGSQLTKLQPIYESAQKIAKLVHSLLALKIDIKFFDIGGGLGITYSDETTINPYDYAQSILECLRGLDLTIICEPGRFIIGNAGVFLVKVLYEKISQNKRFVIVDGAMNDLIRPSLYNAYHQIIPLTQSQGEKSPADIVGPICESGDYLGKNIELPPLKEGDILAILSSGAYGFSMSSNYNTRPRCAEVAISQGKIKLIRKRETFEDLIALEKDLMGDF